MNGRPYRTPSAPSADPPDPRPIPPCVHCSRESVGYDRARREGRCYWHEKIARLASIDDSLKRIADALDAKREKAPTPAKGSAPCAACGAPEGEPHRGGYCR